VRFVVAKTCAAFDLLPFEGRRFSCSAGCYQADEGQAKINPPSSCAKIASADPTADPEEAGGGEVDPDAQYVEIDEADVR
jgi:hypothetical protein